MRFLTLCFLLLSVTAFSQDEPQIFEPGIISNGGVFGFTLSPDGNEAFWVNSNGGRDTLVIMHAVKNKGAWSTPQPASFSGKGGTWKDIDPVFSPDGKMILFQSNRPVASKPNRKGFDIWAVKKEGNGWSSAFHLGNTINSDASESFASMSENGNIYFMMDNPDQIGSSDLYVSAYKKGKYQLPTNLGTPINTPFRESNPYISPKEDYIIYFSSDSTGYGDVDLLISLRKNNAWTKPQNLGKPINSTVGEFCPFVHEKEGKIYFSRTTQRADKRRTENIYSYPFNPKDF